MTTCKKHLHGAIWWNDVRRRLASAFYGSSNFARFHANVPAPNLSLCLQVIILIRRTSVSSFTSKLGWMFWINKFILDGGYESTRWGCRLVSWFTNIPTIHTVWGARCMSKHSPLISLDCVSSILILLWDDVLMTTKLLILDWSGKNM